MGKLWHDIWNTTKCFVRLLKLKINLWLMLWQTISPNLCDFNWSNTKACILDSNLPKTLQIQLQTLLIYNFKLRNTPIIVILLASCNIRSVLTLENEFQISNIFSLITIRNKKAHFALRHFWVWILQLRISQNNYSKLNSQNNEFNKFSEYIWTQSLKFNKFRVWISSKCTRQNNVNY